MESCQSKASRRLSTATPCVSVCIPTFNGAAHLRECFEAIQSQTLQDFEIIVVDDRSSDHTLKIALEFARRDRRFQVSQNAHRLGLAQNWNRSIELSCGEWIKFVFQDDLLHETCLERLVDACRQSHSTFGFSDRELLIEGVVDDVWLAALHEQGIRTDAIYQGQTTLSAEEFIEASIAHPSMNLVGEPTTAIFHRSAVSEVGYFEPHLIQLADTEYWMRLGAKYGVLHVPEALATFRVHRASTTSRNLASREYRMLTLDPLVQHYLILRKPYYRSYRKRLFRKQGLLPSWWRCIREAYVAADRRHAASALESEWASVASAFPGLRLFVVVYACVRCVRKAASTLFFGLTRSKTSAPCLSK